MLLDLSEASDMYILKKVEERKKDGRAKPYNDWEKSLMLWSFEDGYKKACEDFESLVKYNVMQSVQKVLREIRANI